MMRTVRWNSLFSLLFLLCLGLGCGGSGGSQNGTLAQNPVPTLTGVTPNSASAGNAALTVTVSGSSFIPASVIQWNSTALSTTYVSSTSLTAQIPASDLSSTGSASVTVQNPPPGGGTSHSINFNINSPGTNLTVLDLAGNDLAWNPNQQKLYVAVPTGASTNGSSITVVDPIAGSVVNAQPLSSAPTGLVISDDSQYLYAVISGGSVIQRFILPAISPDIQWSLGTDPMSGTANLAGDIKVEPGAAHTLAVSLGQYGYGSVGVFDDSVERSGVEQGGVIPIGNSLQWKPDGSELYAAYTLLNDSPYSTVTSDDALFKMPVTNSGVGAVTTYHSTFRREGARLHSDPTTGYIYGDWGEVINATNGVPVGNYPWRRPDGIIFPGLLSVVDPTLKRFYTLLEVNEPDGSLVFQIETFDQSQFQLLSTIVIPKAVGEPTNFLRWGQAGLAFVTRGLGGAAAKLYILDGSFVNPSGTQDTSVGMQLNPLPTITGISPITATVGSGGHHAERNRARFYWAADSVLEWECTSDDPAEQHGTFGASSGF